MPTGVLLLLGELGGETALVGLVERDVGFLPSEDVGLGCLVAVLLVAGGDE